MLGIPLRPVANSSDDRHLVTAALSGLSQLLSQLCLAFVLGAD